MSNPNIGSHISLSEEIIMMEDSLKVAPKRLKWRIENNIKAARKLVRADKQSQIDLLTSLKDRMAKNHETLVDVLVYYSNAEAVSFDVRRIARKYCAKYGIDFSKEGI